ncbi:hypothetical protein HDC33_000398 [Sporosarcina sp. JAI121]|nr:hypothetical protein [Sporosarcina sp. JAI121]
MRAEIILKTEKSLYAMNDVKRNVLFSQLRLLKESYLNCVRTWYLKFDHSNEVFLEKKIEKDPAEISLHRIIFLQILDYYTIIIVSELRGAQAPTFLTTF